MNILLLVALSLWSLQSTEPISTPPSSSSSSSFLLVVLVNCYPCFYSNLETLCCFMLLFYAYHIFVLFSCCLCKFNRLGMWQKLPSNVLCTLQVVLLYDFTNRDNMHTHPLHFFFFNFLFVKSVNDICCVLDVVTWKYLDKVKKSFVLCGE